MQSLYPSRGILRLTSICIFLVLASCDSPKPSGVSGSKSGNGLPAYCADYEKPAVKTAALSLASDLDATYDGKVKGILDGKCAYAGCHVAGARAPDLSTYLLAKASGARIVARGVNATPTVMPPAAAANGALDAVAKDVLQTWANKNFPQTFVAATPAAAAPDPAPAAAATPAAAPAFADIEKLMTDKTCVSCHSTASHQGDVILDTLDGYNAKAAKVPEKLKAVHFGVSLDATQLKLTADYAASLVAPKEEAAGTTAPAADEAKEPGEVPPECVVPEKTEESPIPDAEPAAAETPATDADFSKVLNPLKLTECHDEGVLYDRRTKDCHVATIDDSYECDWDGVKVKFKDIIKDDVLQKLQDDKWDVDQCGAQDANPVVFLIQADTSEGFLNLGIKVLEK
jgi:hypothetical protein